MVTISNYTVVENRDLALKVVAEVAEVEASLVVVVLLRAAKVLLKARVLGVLLKVAPKVKLYLNFLYKPYNQYFLYYHQFTRNIDPFVN
jgi:hypothetical protein